MLDRRLNNLSILCLFICIGLRATLQEDSKESTGESDEGNFDFFDFPLAKFLKQMKEIDQQQQQQQQQEEQDAEEIPHSIKNKVPILPEPKVIEPEAEMLPAHYTGIKPPGVDHMELIITDAKMANSDDDIYVISMTNSKLVHRKKDTEEKPTTEQPHEIQQNSHQLRNTKSICNYIYKDVFQQKQNNKDSDKLNQSIEKTSQSDQV